MATLRVATSNARPFFADERPGDVLLYAPSGDESKRLLLGNTSNTKPVLTLESATATFSGTVNSVELRSPWVISKEIHLIAEDPRLAEFSSTIGTTTPEDILQQLSELRARVAFLENPYSTLQNFVLKAGAVQPILVGALLTVPSETSVSSSDTYSLNPMNGYAIEFSIAQKLTWPTRQAGVYQYKKIVSVLTTSQSFPGTNVELYIDIEARQNNAATFGGGMVLTNNLGAENWSWAYTSVYGTLQDLLDDSVGLWKWVFTPSPSTLHITVFKDNLLKFSTLSDIVKPDSLLNDLCTSAESIINPDNVIGTTLQLPIKVFKDQGVVTYAPATYPLTMAPPDSVSQGTPLTSVGRFTSYSTVKPTQQIITTGGGTSQALYFAPSSTMNAINLALPSVQSIDVDMAFRLESLVTPNDNSYVSMVLVLQFGATNNESLTFAVSSSGMLIAKLWSGAQHQSWPVLSPNGGIVAGTVHQLHTTMVVNPDTVSFTVTLDGTTLGTAQAADAAVVARLGTSGMQLSAVHINKMFGSYADDNYDMHVLSLTVSNSTV
jgi:hypothetical protein